MMHIIYSPDQVEVVEDAKRLDYDRKNPLVKLSALMERLQFAAEREHYLAASLNYLFPINDLVFYGPSKWGDRPDYYKVTDPQDQDIKQNLQQQNLKDFQISDTYMVRGWIRAGDWIGPFLKFGYNGGPDSKLSRQSGRKLGPKIQLRLKVGDEEESIHEAPYNEENNCYEVELWSFNVPNDLNIEILGASLYKNLGEKGRRNFDTGFIKLRNDLAQGSYFDFQLENLSPDQDIRFVHPENIMHPVLPLNLEVIWQVADENGQLLKDGVETESGLKVPYRFQFNMCLRGWDNFLKYGSAPNLHGGINLIEYRTLLSNYFISDDNRNPVRLEDLPNRPIKDEELRRELEPWNYNTFNTKDHSSPLFNGPNNSRAENFMAVNFIDLDIFRPNCGIGLHRHRDNQEIFLMIEGSGLMITGDWCKIPQRERCFEVRTVKAGHLVKIRGGQLHGLLNPSDENIVIFIFGGYD